MMKLLFFVLLSFMITLATAQNINFKKDDDVVKVKKGDVVFITPDTAYLVSYARAQYLNSKLEELICVKDSFNHLVGNYSEIIQKLSAIQRSLSKYIVKLNKENKETSNSLDATLIDLDKSITDFKASNLILHENNKALLEKINRLEEISTKLKRENRWIWWNGLTDKLIVLFGGIGVGFLLASL